MKEIEQKLLHQREAKCVQEEAPGCTAACPVHVDVRGMVEALRKNDYGAGFKLFHKAVPFPRIISRICDQPCQKTCKRKEIDEPIAINALEKVCVDNSRQPGARLLPVKAKDKKVAVIGAGLSGLTVAAELTKKGYGVVIYEAADCLGGSIRQIAESRLPRQAIEDDIAQLKKNSLVEIHCNTAVGNDNGSTVSFAGLCKEFDAIYLGIGRQEAAPLQLGLELTAAGNLVIDPLTLATSHSLVFAGGSLRWGGEGRSPITSISEGKIAVNSIDRLLQNASLTANRGKEGPYPTSLYTNTAGIAYQAVVQSSDPLQGYTAAEALQEANRCLLCQCLECVKVCEFLAHYRSYPKRYVREVYNNLSIVMGIHHANKMINSCSLCGLCEEVCPGGLNMGEVFREARQMMVKKEKMPPSAHDFALRDLEFSTGDKFVLNRHQPGFTTSGVMFFPGCQLSASAPHYVRRMYEFLCEKIAGGVGLSLGCCGAPADWAGQEKLFKEIIMTVENEWQSLGRPKVITGCPTCYSIFKRELPGMDVETIWTLLEQTGLPDQGGRGVAPKKLAVHDACTTRHEVRLHAAIRNILRELGHQIVELDNSRQTTECCGYGGLMIYANRELARQTIKRRTMESEDDYLAYCAMCRDNFARQGKRVYHLLDLIFGSDQLELAEQKGPGISERQENRARCKQTLLKEVWGEEVEEELAEIKLIIPESVRLILEDRMILTADITKVIAYGERTGNRLKNTERNSYIAYFRPVSVTYWVEYSPQGESFLVHNAYSHRLEITG
ncbi:MAG: pyridine nucleotide-disulfide oxidoreductase/dicluster-binding protein [Peptococcaceae bacterium]